MNVRDRSEIIQLIKEEFIRQRECFIPTLAQDLIIPTPEVKLTAIQESRFDDTNYKSLIIRVKSINEEWKKYNPQIWLWKRKSGSRNKRMTEDPFIKRKFANWRHPVHLYGENRNGSRWYGGKFIDDDDYSIKTEWDFDGTPLILNSLTDDLELHKFFSYKVDDVSLVIPSYDFYDPLEIKYPRVVGNKSNTAYTTYFRFTLTLEHESFGEYPFIHSDPSDVIKLKAGAIGTDPDSNFYKRLTIQILN